jgi:hypothetical protein
MRRKNEEKMCKIPVKIGFTVCFNVLNNKIFKQKRSSF